MARRWSTSVPHRAGVVPKSRASGPWARPLTISLAAARQSRPRRQGPRYSPGRFRATARGRQRRPRRDSRRTAGKPQKRRRSFSRIARTARTPGRARRSRRSRNRLDTNDLLPPPTLGVHHPYNGTDRVVAPHAFGQAERRCRPDPDTIWGHFPNRAYDDAHGGPQFVDLKARSSSNRASRALVVMALTPSTARNE